MDDVTGRIELELDVGDRIAAEEPARAGAARDGGCRREPAQFVDGGPDEKYDLAAMERHGAVGDPMSEILAALGAYSRNVGRAVRREKTVLRRRLHRIGTGRAGGLCRAAARRSRGG